MWPDRSCHGAKNKTIEAPKAAWYGHERGFTLLEALIALVIVSLTVSILINAVSDSLTRARQTGREALAATLADGLLARLGTDRPLQPGVTRGTQADLSWRLVISPLEIHAAVAPLDKVDLTITTRSHHPIGHWLTLRLAFRRPTRQPRR